MMRQIILIFLLMIICITVLLIMAPFVDHFFYVHHKIEEIEKHEVYLMVLVHIILVGILLQELLLIMSKN